MKTALQLRDELGPFVRGERYTVMSEIESLLHDLYTYLEDRVQQETAIKAVGDPTIETQMELDIPKPGQNPGRVHFYQFELLEE